MATEKAEIDIPETWDTIKYTNPIYPTYSRGKVGTYSYTNDKYHCYRIIHSSPTYDLMPYRPTGFGFAERNRDYIPLSHVQDRTHVRVKNLPYEKPEMTKIYENAMDTIREKIDCTTEYLRKKKREESETRNIERNYRNLISDLKYETDDLINNFDDAINDVKYNTHQINQLIRNGQEIMRQKRSVRFLF